LLQSPQLTEYQTWHAYFITHQKIFMIKHILTCLLFTGMLSQSYSQNDTAVVANKKVRVYTLKPSVDIPIVAVGTIWCGYAFTKIYDKPAPSEEQILNLHTSDINGFDRWAAHPYSQSLDDLSYIPFYASVPLPFIFFLTGKDTRKDFWQLSFLYWETMATIGMLGTSATYFVNRYRPYAYFHDTDERLAKATGKVARNSFYAGHVEIAAVTSFFIAKVYSDYHPDSKIKWVYWTAASLSTVSMSYMRLQGGQHFPSDIILGAAAGALSGILVPHFHKTNSAKSGGMSVIPYHYDGITGFVMRNTIK
jgi:membrane-associated phospholipid phosphatase